jgi:hypothetical protein
MARRKILVIATGDDPPEVVAEGPAEVLVVAPALAGRLEYWASDDRRARRDAEERLERCLDALARRGIPATGWVGDADPLLAIADALSLFAADEIAVTTCCDARGDWLARDVVGRARRRFDRPVSQLAA